MTSPGMIMDTTSHDQDQDQHQQQPHLKCPRCDSSNTKFCYFNNYSLTQPRHFCKACKRYWTRGGTLRNVPVGGGNRKHKRVKKLATSYQTPISSATTAPPNPNIQSHVGLSSSSRQTNPLYYGLSTNSHELNLQYPKFNEVSGYDFQPQLNVPGLGFSFELLGSEVNNDNYRNDFDFSKRGDDVVTSNSLHTSYPVHGSSSSNSTSTLTSLIALQHQKLISSGFKDMQGPFENVQMEGDVEGRKIMREAKMEVGSNKLNWDIYNQNQFQNMINSSDTSLWNTSNVGTWLDPSVASLI